MSSVFACPCGQQFAAPPSPVAQQVRCPRCPRVLLDPNALSPDGTVALGAAAPTQDGALLGYSLSRSGSDRQERTPDHGLRPRILAFTCSAWSRCAATAGRMLARS